MISETSDLQTEILEVRNAQSLLRNANQSWRRTRGPMTRAGSVTRMTRREWIAAACVIAVGAAVLSFRGVYEPDLWWHLAQGRENVTHHLVRANVFSFTYPEYRQHFTSWGFDSLAYVCWRVAGLTGIQVLELGLLTATLGIVYATCRRRSSAAVAAAVLLLGFIVIEPRAIPRPHLASFLGLAVCALIAERAVVERSSRPLVWTIPCVAIWSNVHVECVFGVLFVILFASGELAHPVALSRTEARRALWVAIACALATMANPYGVGLLRYTYENASVPQILQIAELGRPYLPNYAGFYAFAGLAVIVLMVRPRDFTIRDALIVVAFGALGARYLRLTPLLVIASAPIVAARLGVLVPTVLDPRALLITVAAASVALCRLPISAFVTELTVEKSALEPRAFFSRGAADFSRSKGLRGPMFNSFNLGGHLAWTMYPDGRTFVDSRLQAYPPEHFRAILRASASQPDWDRLIADVDWAVLSVARRNQLSGAGRFPRTAWATVYWDNAAEVVVRRGSAYGGMVDAYEYAFVTPDADPLMLVARLVGADGDRVRSEARRNRTENPQGFTAAALLCVMGDRDSCTQLDQLARERPETREIVERVRGLTGGTADRPPEGGRHR
jgi:hypothetical protein